MSSLTLLSCRSHLGRPTFLRYYLSGTPYLQALSIKAASLENLNIFFNSIFQVFCVRRDTSTSTANPVSYGKWLDIPIAGILYISCVQASSREVEIFTGSGVAEATVRSDEMGKFCVMLSPGDHSLKVIG